MVDSQRPIPTVKVASLQRTLTLLTISFALCYISLGVVLFASTRESTPLYINITLLLFLTYYVLLGFQASQLGKSAITWVGISILTSPLGPIIFYVWAWRDTKAASRLKGYTKEVVNQIAEQGDFAFQAHVAKSKNPYLAPNTANEDLALASFWDRGYSVAERRQRAQS